MSVQKGRPEIQCRRVSAVALQRHNLPTADFSVRDHAPPSPVSRTWQKCPEVRSVAFRGSTTPALDGSGLCDHCSFVWPGRPRYGSGRGFARRFFFQTRLGNALALTNPSPPSDWIEHAHLQATRSCSAQKRARADGAARASLCAYVCVIQRDNCVRLGRASGAVNRALRRVPTCRGWAGFAEKALAAVVARI